MENKQNFIGQVFTSKSPARSMEDVDETALTYAETKAIATKDPRIKDKMELTVEVSKLKVLRSHHANTSHALEDKTLHHYPMQIAETEGKIKGLQRDLETLKENPPLVGDNFKMEVNGVTHTERKTAGEAIKNQYLILKENKEENVCPLGKFRGFDMTLVKNDFGHFNIELKNEGVTHNVSLEESPLGNITRINNQLEQVADKLESQTNLLERLNTELATATVECKKPFPREEEYRDKSAKLEELDRVLGGSTKQRSPEEKEARLLAQEVRLSDKEAKNVRKEVTIAKFKKEKKEAKIKKSKTKGER